MPEQKPSNPEGSPTHGLLKIPIGWRTLLLVAALVLTVAVLDGIPGAYRAGSAWLLAGVVLGLPCLAIHAILIRTGRSVIGIPRTLQTGILMALVACLAFWIWWLSPAAGRVFSFGLPLAAAPVWLLARKKTGPERRVGGWFPDWAGLALASIFLLAWLLMGAGDEWPNLSRLAANRSMPALPVDGELPLRLALRIADGAEPGILVGDWLTSDRPPLQAGWTLLLLPWMKLAGVPEHTAGLVSGLWMQMLWWPAMGALLSLLGLNRRQAWLIRAALLPIGFLALHSVFVWPKLAAGSLFLGGMLAAMAAFRLPERARAPSLLAGLGFGLGWLSHGGVAFAGLAALIFLPWWIGRVGWRATGLLLSTIVLLSVPWLLYQKLYDPPGDRLLKWHLAGVSDVDDRDAATAIIQTYREMDWDLWWEIHRENAVRVVGRHWDSFGRFNLDRAEARRWFEFAFTFRAMGWWNLGWVALFILSIGQRGRADAEAMGAAWFLLSWVFLTLFVWWLLLVGPNAVSIHQGSFTSLLVLLPVLAYALFRVQPIAFGVVAAIQVIVFLTTWVPVQGAEGLGVGGLASSVAAGGWLGLWLIGLLGRRVDSGHDAPSGHEKGPATDGRRA